MTETEIPPVGHNGVAFQRWAGLSPGVAAKQVPAPQPKALLADDI